MLLLALNRFIPVYYENMTIHAQKNTGKLTSDIFFHLQVGLTPRNTRTEVAPWALALAAWCRGQEVIPGNGEDGNKLMERSIKILSALSDSSHQILLKVEVQAGVHKPTGMRVAIKTVRRHQVSWSMS